MKIDERILETDSSICREIRLAKDDSKEIVESAKIVIKLLRDLVEQVSFKEYCVDNGYDILPTNNDDYTNNKKGKQHVAKNRELKYLNTFHNSLEIAMPHFSVNKNLSRVLFEKYFSYLVKIKKYQKDYYNLEILSNLHDFPFEKDPKLYAFYEEIFKKIIDNRNKQLTQINSGRCYVTRKRTILINNEVFYELTLLPVNKNASKFDKITVYSLDDIPDYYATVFSLVYREIKFEKKVYKASFVMSWKVSIRPCELKSIGKLFGFESNINAKYTTYRNLMDYLTENKCNLLDILMLNERDYLYVMNTIKGEALNSNLIDNLGYCRHAIDMNKKGTNVLKYLLYTLRRTILENQMQTTPNWRLSNLYLINKTIPFEEMPFCASLVNHNPNIYSLLECFDVEGKEHELFGRYINNNSNNNNILYTKIDEIEKYSDDEIDILIDTFNKNITYRDHKPKRHIEKNNNYLYVNENEANSFFIINKLIEKTKVGLDNYKELSLEWVNENVEKLEIDDEYKINCIENMFIKSKLALIYGSAGTGKTTLIKYISKLFEDKRILYLANTNPAVSNIKRMVNDKNGNYLTIEKAKNGNRINKCDVLIIDECSTVSNIDMKQVLSNIDCDILILAGDIYQIESIKFGNWFSFAKSIIPEYAIYELSETKRTKVNELIKFWQKVRTNENILEAISAFNLFSPLNDSLFEKNYEDEIILCLNYDGLYGINNINRMMQLMNNNKEHRWGLNTYKINDPVLFYETNRYNGLIYNNLKGKIIDIVKNDLEITYVVEIDEKIDEINAISAGLKWIAQNNEKTVLKFVVKKSTLLDDGDDNDDYNTIVPFQVAYAVSIHKSQGLEYDSVKIVITSDNEDIISHNIFYTAVTRAKKELKIYSMDKTISNIINSFDIEKNNRDISLFKSKYNL